MSINIETSWKAVLSEEFEKPYFTKLTAQVKDRYAQNSGAVFPKGAEIFRAFELCTFPNTKVVILGQDPYPTRGHAHGLSFSVNDDVKPFPKSLNNIFKEIADDLGKSVPENGNLVRWARQGVLLLNTVLTVEEGQPDSHKGMGWESFAARRYISFSNFMRCKYKKESSPFDTWQLITTQIAIYLAKMLATKKTSIGRQRRRMHRFEHQMFRGINPLLFKRCFRTP